MGKRRGLSRAANGLFFRNLGWKRTPKGYSQQKFYLGRDESKATLANLQLEHLWEQACRRWERDIGMPRPHEKGLPAPQLVRLDGGSVSNQPQGAPATNAVVSIGVRHTDVHGDRPVWDEVTLAIAEAIRNGDTVARVALPRELASLALESPLVWSWFEQLQNDITVIKIELCDDKAQKHSDEYLRKEGTRLVDMGRRLLHKRVGGQTLHAAFDAYLKWIEGKYLTVEKKLTPWGGTQTRQIAFIRRHLPDCSLGELDAYRIEGLLEILQQRPTGEDGKPVSVSWTQNCIKQFRHFLRWLSRTPEFDWKLPSDLEIPQIRVPLTTQEKAAMGRSLQVQTYNLGELRTLWEYASPFQRLLMLLALNCGFGRAEVASLELTEVLLRQKHPHEKDVGCSSTNDDGWICRVRQKTGVYGEFKLWPETIRAVEWWLRQRAAITIADGVTTLLATKKGHRYDTPTKGNHTNFQIPNSWFQLTKRIHHDNASFRQLSFNKLRKTAGNLIRSESSGEIAGVFLCHGTPVKTDGLLDLYTNRPFAKVFDAIDRVGALLRPQWAGVMNPFPETPKRGGANISHGTIQRIQSMRRQGYKVSHITKKLGVSRETVRRWEKRSKGGR